jgi:hypothetical protein
LAFDAPSVLSSAWQSPEGDAALIFTNISDNPVSFSWIATSADVALPPDKAYDVYILRNGACISEQTGTTLPYALEVDSRPSDIIAVIITQMRGAGPPQFPDCSPSGPVSTGSPAFFLWPGNQPVATHGLPRYRQ